MRRMRDTGRKGRARQMIEDHLGWHAPKYVGKFHNLFAAQVELNMPTQSSHALGERFNHRGSHHRCRRVAEAEANSSDSPVMEFLQLCVGDARMEYGHPSGVGPKLSDSIDRGAIIYAVITGRHDYDARGSDPTLQHPILRHGSACGRHPGTRSKREAGRVIDMHVAIAGMRRSFKFRMAASQRIRRFLGFAR